MTNELDALEKLRTGRIRLQKPYPFFSWLVMSLNLKEGGVSTCGVDYKSNLYYNPEFINQLDREEIQTLLVHEIGHIMFEHTTRTGERNKDVSNMAQDIIINNLLVNNGFHFGKLEENCEINGQKGKGLVPRDNQIECMGIKVKDIDKKFWEEVYDELIKGLREGVKKGKIKIVPNGQGGMSGKDILDEEDEGGGEGEEGEGESKQGKGKQKPKDKGKFEYPSYQGFDEHKSADRHTNKAEVEKAERDMKQRMAEALCYAKQQGKLPAGLERYVDELLESKLNWREILYKYITKEIMCDYSYNYPSKKSMSSGYYMPSVKKESVEISVAVDVSGSIGGDELQEFLSEIVGIAKSFDAIKMNIVFWDTQANNHYVVDNGSIDDILSYEIKGGGGTDFTKIYEWLGENVPDTKILVFLTDGFTSFPSQEDYRTLWVLSKNSCPEADIPFGEVAKMSDSRE